MESKVESRELLCKAASVAGFVISYWMDGTPMVVPAKQSSAANRHPFSWNPLTNDGDAFRLMVLLTSLGVEPGSLILDTSAICATANPERSQRLRICLAAEELYKANILGAVAAYG